MTERRRRGPRGDISREHLLSAADRVLQRDGLTGLSLRAVAAEASVSPNAIYTYVDNMADLRNLLGDAFLARLDLSLLEADDPAEALRGFARQVLGAFAASPGYAALLTSQRIAGVHALNLNEALLRFFVESVGHPLGTATSATWLLTEWIHGKVALEPSNAAPENFRAAIARLEPIVDRWPLTVGMLSYDDERDERAIDLLITAVTTTSQLPQP